MLFKHVLYQLSYHRILFRENDGGRTHDQRSHNPLLYQLSYNLHISWEGWDSSPLCFLCTGFTAQRPSTIWAALPLFRLDGTTRTCARHYSMLRFPKPARFTNSSTSRLYFYKLINELKNKKSFVITEEALYKLYCIVTLITFLKIYFITIPISKRHAIKWTSTKWWTNNRTNMWINLTHAFYIFI